jgi:predicted nucleic acid-binding protein
MEGVGRIYLDTNIFITAFETGTEVSGKLVTLLSTARISPSPRFVTSEMTLAELLVRPFRNNDAGQIALYSPTIASSPWLDAQPVSRDIFISAAGLRASVPSRKLPDAVHLSTAIIAGCTHVLTADKGLGPQTTEDLPIGVLRPDEPTLNALIERLSA